MLRFITLLTFLSVFFSFEANAINIKRWFQDAKYPSQQMIEKQTFTNPAASTSVYVLAEQDGPDSGDALTITTSITNPDMARTIDVYPAGTTADVGSCTVTLSGTDFHGQSITEAYTFAANQSTKQEGLKAFKTVTSIAFAASCEDSPYGATWSVGIGNSLGLKRCMGAAGDFLFSHLNGSKESTAPTLSVDDDEIEKNTADFDGTYNGSNDFTFFYFQNYNEGCVP